MMTGHSRPLLDRDAEILAIKRLLQSAAAGAGGFLVASGEAGIGKTTLLSESVDLAHGDGFTVIRARGSYAEHNRSFGLVRRLFESTSSQACGAQTGSLLTAPPLPKSESRDGNGRDESPFELSLADQDALNSFLSCLDMSRIPILIAIDNLHWSDRASLRWLTTLAERIESVPIAVFATVCGGIPGTDPALLDDLLFSCSSELRIGRLSSTAATTLLEEKFGTRPDEPLVTACIYATEGNPLLLNELTHALIERGLTAEARTADKLPGLVIDSLARSTQVRLRRISSHALSLFRSIAALDGQATYDRLAHITGINLDTVAENCLAMTRMGLATADHPHVKVSQPLVRNAIIAERTSTALQAVHAQAARLLYLDCEPEDAVAEQLLLSSPLRETWVPDLLRSAAQTALASGDTRTAILYLRRALAEPVDNNKRAVMLVELANVSTRTDIASAARNLTQAAALAPPAIITDNLQPAAFDLLILSGREDQAAELVASAGTHTSARLNDSLTVRFGLFAEGQFGRIPPGPLADLRNLEPNNALTYGLTAVAEAVSDGCLADAVSLAQRAASCPLSTPEDLMAHLAATQVLCWAGHLTEARDFCDAVVITAARWRHQSLLALGLSIRSVVHRKLGSLAPAVDDARHGLDLLLASGIRRQAGLMHVALAHLVLALTDSGNHNDAHSLLERSELNGSTSEGYGAATLLFARGHLRRASGHAHASIQDLLMSGRQLIGQGITNPAVVPWRSEAAHALTRIGQPREARRYADEETALARRWGEPGQIGVTLRAQAVANNNPLRLCMVKESIAKLRTTDMKQELARALIDYGLILGQAEEIAKARQTLREAVQLARETDCVELVERSKSALIATGGRIRNTPMCGVASLTKSERKVAFIAATGKTNREIAKQLFVGLRTVEIHLTNSYRKLGIDSRDQLAEAIQAA
jgi:DNA-binding CsgD family transcriptional regulator